jgi:20S proteasome alpha/beta subunit
MTIAFGILATDGVLLCADSEISSGDVKGTDTKLVSAVHQESDEVRSALAVAGSGSWNYFQSLRFKIVDQVFGSLGADAKSDRRIEKRLEKFMLAFHEKHVLPYSHLQTPPFVDVMVATRIKGQNRLWSTEVGVVRDAPFGYDAIGSGQTVAKNLLHAYFSAMPMESAILLAAYVAMRTKDLIAGCGKDTSMISLRDGHPVNLPRKLIQKCELAFESYHAFHAHAFHLMIGLRGGVLMQAEFGGALREFDLLRQEIKETIS